MNTEQFYSKLLREVQVEAADEFDRNFERKAFFTGAPWKDSTRPTTRGSTMMRTGSLRDSIHSQIVGGNIVFTSSLPYASLHNSGGIIKVTAAMKRYFWAMYYKALGGVAIKKDGSRSKRAIALTAEAAYYKSLAIIKVGTALKIPQRQFIGTHPVLIEAIEQISTKHITAALGDVMERLKQK